jgi:hypothetical protein
MANAKKVGGKEAEDTISQQSTDQENLQCALKIC